MKPLQVTVRSTLTAALAVILLAASIDTGRQYAKTHSGATISKVVSLITGQAGTTDRY
jgi:hypothetical protein